MDKNLVEKAIDLIEDKSTKLLNSPKSIKNSLFKKEKKVTVVIASYNAERYIEKSIDSVINQTMLFKQIELIIVDDGSSDGTVDILLKYAKKYSNIIVVLLKENTGTAAMPRNIGIELTTSNKIMFLDSDDWLSKEALNVLSKKMDSNKDDFVVGKTVKVLDNGESIHAEFISYKEVEQITPLEMPYLFYHMGPPSKLIKTSIIKENNIRFPELKFAEDKFFFTNVLLNCSSISVVNIPIGYINRLSSNTESLTRVTKVLDKRKSDMKLIRHFNELKLPIEQEKIIFKRLIEYDLIRSCDSVSFVKSKEKSKFIELIRESIKLLENRSYDIVDLFDSPLYQVAAKLIIEKRDEDFIELFKWYKQDKNKHIVIHDDIAYYEVIPFSESDPYKYIPLNVLVRSIDAYVKDDQYVQTFEIYGKDKDTVEYAIIRDRNKLDNELRAPITIKGNTGEFRIAYEHLDNLQSSLFSIFVRYDGHRVTNIKRLLESHVTYKKRDFMFYTTKVGNLGFSLKDKK